MASIDPLWWNHFFPKLMHNRLRELNALLRQWCSTGYGAHWLAPARTENERIGARDTEQVQRVIDGKTYVRFI